MMQQNLSEKKSGDHLPNEIMMFFSIALVLQKYGYSESIPNWLR